MVSCYAQLNHFTADRDLFSEKWQAIKPCTCDSWTSARVHFLNSPFHVCMNWINKCSQADECTTIGKRKISRLLFADDLVLLSSIESDLQRAFK